jgi:hypothetical protein
VTEHEIERIAKALKVQMGHSECPLELTPQAAAMMNELARAWGEGKAKFVSMLVYVVCAAILLALGKGLFDMFRTGTFPTPQ